MDKEEEEEEETQTVSCEIRQVDFTFQLFFFSWFTTQSCYATTSIYFVASFQNEAPCFYDRISVP